MHRLAVLRALTILVVAAAAAPGCGDGSAKTTLPRRHETSTSAAPAPTDRTLSASECSGAIGAGISNISLSSVDVSDGISDDEVGSVAGQLDGIEQHIPDLTTKGRCMQLLADPAVAENGVRFASWDALAVLSLVPGIESRGAWGYAVAAFQRLADSTR